MPLSGSAEHKHSATRRVAIILLAVLIPSITVIGALVLAMLELNS